MKNRIKRTMVFVGEHKTAIAAGMGVIAGTATYVFLNHSGINWLAVSDDDIDRMRETGSSSLYVTKNADLLLTVIPK